MSDYLFDGEGEPDPEVARFEALLRPLAFKGPPPRLPPPPRRVSRVFIAGGLAVAGALIALLIFHPWRSPAPVPIAPAPPSWAASVRGDGATAGGRAIAGETRLAVGVWLDTGAGRAQLRVDGAGTVDLGPGTRARIVETGAARHRIELGRGALSANIDAPARSFLVETRHAVAIDLGCAFSLSVDDAGRGRLAVTAGRVALSDRAAREVVVAAGAECALTEHGPGTPYFSDASDGLRAALARYEAGAATLQSVLKEARAKDRATLEQLLSTVGNEERNLISKRLGELDADRPSTPLKTHLKKTPKRSTQKIDKPAAPIAPVKKVEPAKHVEPPTKINHDALKDLERSAQ